MEEHQKFLILVGWEGAGGTSQKIIIFSSKTVSIWKMTCFLEFLIKSMAEKAGLPELNQGKRLTNTSVRKRLCQNLLLSNVPDTVAVHVTGHSNPNSLNNYRTLTPLQQKAISNI